MTVSLCNQLSINLSGSDLPNADEVNLSPDCVAYEGGPVLSDLITAAIAMHEDPDAFSRQEIELVKDELELFNVVREEEDEDGKIIGAAGFKNIEVEQLEHDFQNYYYIVLAEKDQRTILRLRSGCPHSRDRDMVSLSNHGAAEI